MPGLINQEQLIWRMCGHSDLSEAVVVGSYPSYDISAPPPPRRAGHGISPSTFRYKEMDTVKQKNKV